MPKQSLAEADAIDYQVAMKSDKFSMDYVVSGAQQANVPNQAPASPAESALNEATILFGQPILGQLSKAANREMRLHDLIDRVNRDRPVSSFEEFQGVINRLASLGLVAIVDRDLRGNHLIRLLKSA
jgi:hypothetical protein